MKLKSVLILSSLLLFTSGCDDKEKEIRDANTMVVEQKIIYNLMDTNLNSYEIEEKKDGRFITKGQEGKVIIFDFFTTWCPSCKRIAPVLTHLQEKYKNKVQVIGVLLEDNVKKEIIDTFKKEHNAQYPTSISRSNRRFAKSIYALIQGPSSMPIPLLVLFKDGKYLNHHIGSIPQEMLEGDIKKAFKK